MHQRVWGVLAAVICSASMVSADRPRGMGPNPCDEDVRRFCAEVRPGEGRIQRCLESHRSELSPRCQAGPGQPSRPSRESSSTESSDAAAADSATLIQRAKEKSPSHWQDALRQGARIEQTPDGKSFYLVWTPKGKRLQDTPVLVGLHGHGSWAADEWAAWQPFLEKHGHSLIALQWWFGGGEGNTDYYENEALSALFEQILVKEHVSPGRAWLHGFSRGSTQTYGLTALDRQRAHPYFAVSVANAGGAMPGFPINQKIEAGRFGAKPLTGSRWILFCGGQDPNPDRDGCPAMQKTGDWIQRYGGSLSLLIQDPTQGHGGFHRNPANAEKALTLIDQNLR